MIRRFLGPVILVLLIGGVGTAAAALRWDPPNPPPTCPATFPALALTDAGCTVGPMSGTTAGYCIEDKTARQSWGPFRTQADAESFARSLSGQITLSWCPIRP